MEEVWLRLCGKCKHFEPNLFGDPGCHKGHAFIDPEVIARCPDKREFPRAHGSDFDMGED